MSRGRINSLVSSVPTDRSSQIGEVLKVAGKNQVSNRTSHFSSHVKSIPVFMKDYFKMYFLPILEYRSLQILGIYL